MNSDGAEKPKAADPLPAQFFYRFLETHGAAVEKTGTGCHAVLPEALRTALKVPEFVHIQTEPVADEVPNEEAPNRAQAEGYAIHYGAPLLDQAIRVACEKVPLLSYRVHIDYLKRQGFDKLIAEQFRFFNAVGKPESHAVVQTEYLVVSCWYSARSDEQKEGIVTLSFNLDTGACVPDVPELLHLMNRETEPRMKAGPEEAARIRALLSRMRAAFKSVIDDATAAFRESMNRRFRRDVESLNAYYDSLQREMEASLRRPGLSPQVVQERQEKIGLIPGELAQKKDDLYKKYGIKINVRPCAMIRIKVPAVKVRHVLSVGKSVKVLSLIYNPITKSMDPVVCDGCGGAAYACSFCGRLHLLCAACGKRCPVCG